MKKRFIKGSIIESVIDPENGTTKIDMLWKINFSRLPYMSHLLGFISFSLNNKDINYINPSLFYYNQYYYVFSFKTTAICSVKDIDKYDEDTGYRIALIKNKKQAMKTYNRLISVIRKKINKYFINPLNEIELENSYDLIDLLSIKMNGYKDIKDINKK